MNNKSLKQQLDEQTLEAENKAKEYWINFSQKYKEPHQRAYFYIGLLILLLLLIYWLTRPDIDLEAKREARMEDRLIKKMEMLKKLKE